MRGRIGDSPLKVAIVAPSPIPFVIGGAEWLWSSLVAEINDRTEHQAELIKLPVREHNLPDLVSAYRTFASLDVGHFDLVITSKYPAWMIDHRNHHVYMVHKLRGLYDTYGAFGLPEHVNFADEDLREFGRFVGSVRERTQLEELFGRFDMLLASRGPKDPAFVFPGPLARELVHALDRVGLATTGVRRYAAISRTVASRRDYFPPGVVPEVVYPPPHLDGLECRGFAHFLFVSRLDGPKRAALVIEAMRHVSANVPLKIAGTGPEQERLQELASGDGRIEFLGPVSSRDLVSLYADAIAVVFVPLQEDFGLVALEAMRAGKPVVTCRDSGGPTEFVRDGSNGFVTEPTPQALGNALNRLASDPELARSLGAEAETTVRSVTWERTVNALMRPVHASASRARTRSRPRLVVLSTFPIYPRLGGGQIRCFYLCRALVSAYEVVIVSLAHSEEPADTKQLLEGLTETVVPKSEEHNALETELTLRAGTPLTDILAASCIEKTPAYLRELRRAASGASGAILEHPYMYPALRLAAPDLPVIYSAHNAEFDLKSQYLPIDSYGLWLRALVRQTESDAINAARLVLTCSPEDTALLSFYYGIEPARFRHIPNGVDTHKIAFTPHEIRLELQRRWLNRFLHAGHSDRRPEQIAIFVASWHPPNLDAAQRIIEFAPQLPEIFFLLIGTHCMSLDRRKLPANILPIGVVSSATKCGILAAAGVAVHPMTLGSGTNLKVAEYFAAGVPVVSTAFGVRGMSLESDVHLKIAELSRFPEEISMLLQDSARLSSMTRRAREVAESTYDWSVLAERMVESVEEALAIGERAGSRGRSCKSV